MHDIIDKDLNFMDTDSVIIASTDPTRIGQLHTGALDVIKNAKEVIISTEDQYPGSKKGINIPVLFHNKPIGVFGITGDPSEVMKYGEMLKRLTEILVNDAYIKEIVYKDRFNEQVLIESILFYSKHNSFYSDDDSFKYDSTLRRRVVFGMLSSEKPYDENQIFSFIKSLYDDTSKPIVSINNNMVVILVVDASSLDLIESSILQLRENLWQRYYIESRFTIGTPFSSNDLARASFDRAQRLHQWLSNNENFTVKIFEKAELGILFSSIDNFSKQSFVDAVLGNLKDNEILAYDTLLTLYEKHNASITQIAEELSIHKNTLQYRLNKLHQLTGYNPREFNGFCMLKMAFSARRSFPKGTRIKVSKG